MRFTLQFIVKFIAFAGFCVLSTNHLKAQKYLSDIDSSFFIKDTVRPVIKRFENLRISGYMQPQFQVAAAKGAGSFAGGNFSASSQSRFMLRRARVKIDYLMMTKDKHPQALFTFQVDATERGVVVRDMFLKLFETKKNMFSMMAGLFARPFGYEVNLSSAFRETPERGRMSQILMPSERDLGVMFTFEPQDKSSRFAHIKFDAGFFNGQGLSGTTDFDSHKDFISRIFIKPYIIDHIDITGGVSFLRGGWQNGTKYVFKSGKNALGDEMFIVDSTESNINRTSPRHYYGADLQVKLHHGWGETEWRAEYWFGTQPGTSVSTTNPGTIPTSNGLPTPTYVRHYDGAFFYFLQNIINPKHQLLLKYDWYDPNIRVQKSGIGKTGTNLTVADIKFSTFGFGYVYHFNPQTKLVLYYDLVRNESTQLAGYRKDLEDDVFTARLQFRF